MPVQDRYPTAFQLYPYERSVDQDKPAHWPVAIIGGGPVGMGLALDLTLQDIDCVVLDDHDGVGAGSRAICFAKRTLEICDRLGAGDAMVDKGVVWNLGRVYRDEREVYAFNLLPEEGHKRPAFINLQQPYFEKFLVERIRAEQGDGKQVSIRGKNRVEAIKERDGKVFLNIETPDGPYQMTADYVVACDGASSPTRDKMGLGFAGRVFEDNFLIADIIMKSNDFPVERRFWFDPPFNRGETALMHKQPDDVWRLDFQLGWDIDRKAELDPDKIRRRVRAMIGPEHEFELEWTSIYTFRCCSMDQYRHGRVFFAGDSAHQVSPFGARGCNGGMQDADNLAWKLASVLRGQAPDALLDTYHIERKYAADENILNSSRTADFLTPRSYAHELFRDAVLDLVEDNDFVRPMVNSGRLSVPSIYDESPLNGPDDAGLPHRTRPGAPASDAPTSKGWLLDLVRGWQVLALNCAAPKAAANGITASTLELNSADHPLLTERYLGTSTQAIYLLRPDQHIVARWGVAQETEVSQALQTALGDRP